jgi:hypothetical protein
VAVAKVLGGQKRNGLTAATIAPRTLVQLTSPARPRILATMKRQLRSILLLAPLVSFGIMSPVAAEPSGFAGFSWGTARAVIEPAMKTQCEFSATYLSITDRQALVCSSYREMDNLGLGPVDVRLEFINDGLQGYTVAVRRAQEAKLRTMAPQLLRAASSTRAGAPPSGTASHMLDRCLPGFFCLTVRTH